MADEMFSPRDRGVLIFAGFTSETGTDCVRQPDVEKLDSQFDFGQSHTGEAKRQQAEGKID